MFHVCFYATLYTCNGYRCAQLAALWERDKNILHDKLGLSALIEQNFHKIHII